MSPLILQLCSVGLCSGDTESLVGHRDVGAPRNAPRQPRVSAGVGVLPGMSAAASPLPTLPIWGCSGAIKPQHESLWILTHLSTHCKPWNSSSPSSGGSFGPIWEGHQGFACSFAWQMNGWGSCRARWILLLLGTRSHTVLLQHWCHLGPFTRQKSPGNSGLICCKLLQTICPSKIMPCFDGLVTRTFNPAS